MNKPDLQKTELTPLELNQRIFKLKLFRVLKIAVHFGAAGIFGLATLLYIPYAIDVGDTEGPIGVALLALLGYRIVLFWDRLPIYKKLQDYEAWAYRAEFNCSGTEMRFFPLKWHPRIYNLLGLFRIEAYHIRPDIAIFGSVQTIWVQEEHSSRYGLEGEIKATMSLVQEKIGFSNSPKNQVILPVAFRLDTSIVDDTVELLSFSDVYSDRLFKPSPNSPLGAPEDVKLGLHLLVSEALFERIKNCHTNKQSFSFFLHPFDISPMKVAEAANDTIIFIDREDYSAINQQFRPILQPVKGIQYTMKVSR